MTQTDEVWRWSASAACQSNPLAREVRHNEIGHLQQTDLMSGLPNLAHSELLTDKVPNSTNDPEGDKYHRCVIYHQMSDVNININASKFENKIRTH